MRLLTPCIASTGEGGSTTPTGAGAKPEVAPATVGAEVTQLGTGAAVREWWWLLGFAGSAA